MNSSREEVKNQQPLLVEEHSSISTEKQPLEEISSGLGRQKESPSGCLCRNSLGESDAEDIEEGTVQEEQEPECIRDGIFLHESLQQGYVPEENPVDPTHTNTNERNRCERVMEGEQVPRRPCLEEATSQKACQASPVEQQADQKTKQNKSNLTGCPTLNTNISSECGISYSPVSSEADSDSMNDGCLAKPVMSDVTQIETATLDKSCIMERCGKIAEQSGHSKDHIRHETICQRIAQTWDSCRPKYHILLCVQMSFLLMCPLFYAMAAAAVAAFACLAYCFCCILVL